MICPNCGKEYPEGVTVCPDCNVPLVPPEKINQEFDDSDEWVIVFTTDAEYEAEMLKANIESAGIEVRILGQKDQSFPAVGDLSIIKILVKEQDAEDALAIINDINKREGGQ